MVFILGVYLICFSQSVRLMCRLNADARVVLCATFRAERLLYLQRLLYLLSFLLVRELTLPAHLKSKGTRLSLSVPDAQNSSDCSIAAARQQLGTDRHYFSLSDALCQALRLPATAVLGPS